MFKHPLLHTFTFRLASIYVVLFSLSVILLFAFIYTFAARYVANQTTDAVKGQYYELLSEYRIGGADAVKARIQSLIQSDDDGSEVYMLVDRGFTRLAGNLNEWPKNAPAESMFETNGRWIRFEIEATRNAARGIAVKAIMIPLSKWRFLLVGKTTQSQRKIEQTILQTFGASLVVTLAMAFLGALVMTRSVMRRINVINRSALAIMQGDLAARVPYTKGGDEFDELSTNLNRMLDTIESLMQSIAQFAGNIAHDLRSPLSRIVSRLEEGLRSIASNNPARPLLEKNIADMQELIGTFNSILRISELESQASARSFDSCDLTALLTELIEFYEPYASDKDIRIVSALEKSMIISGERNLLTQAFANLLDNAIKFTPRGGMVTLSSAKSDDFCEIHIADSGPGIPPEYRGKVFEKFFRLESSRHTKGNGLGLSLVAAVARIHGAELTLEDNRPGLKVRVRFASPLE